MLKVWVLIIVGANAPAVTIDGYAFETAERCLRNVSEAKKQFNDKYNQLLVECHELEINKGK